MSVDLRHGRWESALADVGAVGTIITDPPYGERTHRGALQGGQMADGRTLNLTDTERGGDGCSRTPITYPYWTAADVAAFVSSWAPRTERWIVAMTSHDLLPAWEAAAEAVNWHWFAPIAAVISGMGVRVLADGPANWTIHLAVMRRRSRQLGSKPGSIWRSLPGGYAGPMGSYQQGGRGKPLWLLDALVRDYSDAGHVVCDPCAGWATTLVAARNAGRLAIGADEDPVAHAAGLAYLSGNMLEFERLVGEPKADDRALKRAKAPQLELLAGGW